MLGTVGGPIVLIRVTPRIPTIHHFTIDIFEVWSLYKYRRSCSVPVLHAYIRKWLGDKF